jgi:hypothetical protein
MGIIRLSRKSRRLRTLDFDPAVSVGFAMGFIAVIIAVALAVSYAIYIVGKNHL